MLTQPAVVVLIEDNSNQVLLESLRRHNVEARNWAENRSGSNDVRVKHLHYLY